MCQYVHVFPKYSHMVICEKQTAIFGMKALLWLGCFLFLKNRFRVEIGALAYRIQFSNESSGLNSSPHQHPEPRE